MPFFNYSFLRPFDEEETFKSPYRKLLFDNPDIESPVTTGQQDSPLRSIYQGMRQPEALLKLQRHLESAPTEEQYRPGKMNRLSAALSGLSEGWFRGAGAGVQTAQNILREPFESAVRTHELKGRGLRDLAGIEENRMQHEVNLAKAIEASRMAEERLEMDRQTLENQLKNGEITRKNYESQMKKRDLDMERSGFEKIEDKATGTVRWHNPWTGQDLGEPIKVDESIAEQENRLKGRFSFEEGTRQRNRKALQEDSQAHAAKLQESREKANIARDAARAELTNSRTGPQRINQNKRAALALYETNPRAFRDLGFMVDKGDVIPPADPPDMSENPDGYAKYVAIHNSLYKNIPGAPKLSMPAGFDEFGNRTVIDYDK